MKSVNIIDNGLIDANDFFSVLLLLDKSRFREDFGINNILEIENHKGILTVRYVKYICRETIEELWVMFGEDKSNIVFEKYVKEIL